jgi:hypothetical protein
MRDHAQELAAIERWGRVITDRSPLSFRRRATLRVLAGAITLGAMLAAASAGAASPDPFDIATGGAEYQLDWIAGSVSFSLVAQGTPTDAGGRIEYRRTAEGFDANSAGKVTCYLQVGNRGYFSGEFDRPFLSGPTEIPFFSGTVIDGDQESGDGIDHAFVELNADSLVPCDDPGSMAFLDAMAATSPVTHGNIEVR